ncbi:hypothetical protein BT93_L0494 [Corymbia citriodora subsp. variegata]|uniref:Uncharacterized protein n=1 Tax=Corymbia citriodora subsp. variegata TaxID=360336 RepID=A0A8T0CS57_CORYI|nr:hypothetical protein BT93_L0494 [Corymbia citriodora subsp. variegata]
MSGSSIKAMPCEINSMSLIMKFGYSCHFPKQTITILSQSWQSIPRNFPRKKRERRE